MKKQITILFLFLLPSQQMVQGGFENRSESFIKSMLTEYRLIQTNEKVDRFAGNGASWSKRVELKSKDLFVNKYNQKDYQEYTFSFIYFTNKDSCSKARQAYLDNFSFGGKLTAETKSIKRAPSFNLINDHSIIILEVSCESHQMDKKWSWEKLKNKLIVTFGTENSEVIENGCGGPITWKNNKNR